MTWIRDKVEYLWWERLLLSVIRSGKLPRHVALIMDGNRRFARKSDMEVIAGHSKGFDKLTESLVWLWDLGIEEVTVYAFSLENYKRSKGEVNDLMGLAESKFSEFRDESDKLKSNGIRVRVFGDMSRVPPDLAEKFKEIMEKTKNNSRRFFNVAFAYTSREEMSQAARGVAADVVAGNINPRELDIPTYESYFYGGGTPVDLLIRTSGEVRLSDFMLWQSSYAVTYFTKVYWPEFSFFHLCAGIFHYQRHLSSIQSVRTKEG